MSSSLLSSMVVCPDLAKEYPKITHGEGVYLFAEDGKKYIDASAGSAAVANIGHGITELSNIIKEQAERVTVLPTHYFSSDVLEDYLDELVAFAPPGFSKAWTVSSGSEAVENAIKLALQYQQLKGNNAKYKVIGRWSSYHGNSVFTLDVGGMKWRRNTYNQWMNNFPHLAPAYYYRCTDNLTEAEYCRSLVAEFDALVKKEGADTIAAFVVEPVVAAALGAVAPPQEYFKEIRRICTENDIVFIADEVLTGFGRTGRNFGIENFDVTPDIIATGKGISGGYFPLSAIILHHTIADVFVNKSTPFLGGHTYACNPLGSAIGKFVLDYLKREKLVERSQAMGKIALDKLRRLYRHEIIGDVRGLGLMMGIELVRDKITKEPFPASFQVSKRIGELALAKGVILYPGKGSVDGQLGDHIMITPPLTISEQEFESVVAALDESIAEMVLILQKENALVF